MRELTTNQKGAIAEAAIAATALKFGIGVARPLSDESYDLILDAPCGLVRVQCKWAVKRGEVIVITCRRNRRGPDGYIRRPYAPDEIDLYVPHQANKRILDGIAKRLGIPHEKVVFTLAKHGNTSAASIPLALNQAFEDHRLSERRLVLMEAMGGGFTWGAALARW